MLPAHVRGHAIAPAPPQARRREPWPTFAAVNPDDSPNNYGCPGSMIDKDDLTTECDTWPCVLGFDATGAPTGDTLSCCIPTWADQRMLVPTRDQ